MKLILQLVHYSLLSLLLLSFPIAVHSELTAEQRTEKARELDKLRQRMSLLRKKLEQQQLEKNQVAEALREIEIRIGERAYILKRIKRHLRKQKKELKQLQKQQRETRNKLSQYRNILEEQIMSAYMIGKQEYLKLLLNQENPSAIGRTLVYYDYFHQARSHQIKDALSLISELNEITMQVKNKAEELQLAKKQQLKEKQKLEDDLIDRSVILKKLETDIADKGKRLKKLVSDEQSLQQLLNEIHRIMPSMLTEVEKRESFANRRGRLQWPVKGRVKRLFGKSRKAANLKWNGVLIPVAEGIEVKAISHGRVAYADWLRGYGMLIIIDHGDGYMTLYGHNQALYKETGDWVEEGEAIATVGKSGGQSKSGLYFEVRVNGRPSNPVKWCRG